MDFVGNVQLVAGNASTVHELAPLLKQASIAVTGNPDVYVREFSAFGVEEARELAARASSRAVSSSRRVFIVVTPGMTAEAQNALLKTLEEPSGDALFFFIVPSPISLLPTLRSRAQLLPVGRVANESVIDAKTFLQASAQARLDMLKPLFEKDDDEKRDLSGSIAFLCALEQELSQEPQRHLASIKAIYRARTYLGDKGSLGKALLEQVALLVE